MPEKLDAGSLEILLHALRTDSQDASTGYERLRQQLIRFFRWNNCVMAEDLADVALDRLAQKLSTNSEMIDNPAHFALGIGRMLVREQQTRDSKEKKAYAYLAWSHVQLHGRSEDIDEYQICLDHCLQQLSPQSRRLIECYYTGDAAERIHNRKQLADEMNIDLNALRNRALRLRKQLESCMEQSIGSRAWRDVSKRMASKNSEQSK